MVVVAPVLPPPLGCVVVIVLVAVKDFVVVKPLCKGELTVAVIEYKPEPLGVIVNWLLTRDFPEIAVFPTEPGLQLNPLEHVKEILKVVLESPALFTPTVKTTELPLATVELEIVEEIVRLAGVKTVNPVGYVSERVKPVPLSVAVTLAVILLE